MRTNNILGIIYSNAYDDCLPELTALRTMGSVPFGGRYRLIDFVLSNMVNCGVPKVGIITKSNYNSLMDHIGSGREWDLSRKRDGLFLLPPFNTHEAGHANNRMTSLISIKGFLAASSQEYVILSDCNVVCNMDYERLLNFHEEKNADISICYASGKIPTLKELMSFEIDENSRIEKIAISSDSNDKEEGNYSLNIIIMRKSLLERLINEAQSQNYNSFVRDIMQNSIKNLAVYAYKPKEFCRTVDSLLSYYNISMELLNPENRKTLFDPQRPVFTKVRDDVPVIYGLKSIVKNSLIADGCVIEGEVENCILFRGAKIGRGAVVKNSIIMQGAFIGDEAVINGVIMDKNVTIKPHKTLCGDASYPFYVGKGIVV